jgi:ribosomal-protein-alanine N-acetyltransferase
MAAQPEDFEAWRISADNIRQMGYDDLSRVIEIETAAYSHPWTLGIFRDCLRVGYDGWVYEHENRISGYAILMLSGAEAHVLNICVHPDCQRRGIGRLLLTHLTQHSREAGADTILLEVRESNIIAMQLYLSEGFNQLGVRRGYYPDVEGREDAVILARSLVDDYDPHLGI